MRRAVTAWLTEMRHNLLRLAEGRVLVEQLRLLLGNVSSSAILGIITITLLVWVLSSDRNLLALMVWGVAAGLPRIFLMLAGRRLLASGISCEQAPRLVWQLVIYHAAHGAVWGALAWLTLDTASVAGSVLVVAVLILLASSSMSLFSPVLPIYVAFSTPILLALVSKLWLMGNPDYHPLGVVAVLYVPMLFMQARNSTAATRAAINLRFENVDLMERLRVETEKAEQANLAKSKFFAAASHDLRQPIHAQGLFLEALARSGLSATQDTILSSVRAASEASAGMLNTLLDFSRVEAGVVEPQIRPFHLQPLLTRIESELAPQANTKGLVYRSRETHAAVESDPALVELILRNLVSNAIRYTEHGGVLVACRTRDDQVLLEVWDTGIGIEPSQHQEIFREFHQLGNPERDRNKGLGLGLAIAQGLARAMGHELSLVSTPGCGSVFRLTLPIARAAVVSDDMETAHSHARILDLRVLVIDDDEAVRAGMAQLLRGWGCACVAAESIAEAQAAARAYRPDIVISDYRLREHRTGVEAIAALRAEFGADLPALLITGDTAPERLREARASGVPLLHKPVSPSLLYRRLESMCPDTKTIDQSLE
jgi:signal transduction histidine kinase